MFLVHLEHIWQMKRSEVHIVLPTLDLAAGLDVLFSLPASEFHPLLALLLCDVTQQLTTKAARTWRGGRAPGD